MLVGRVIDDGTAPASTRDRFADALKLEADGVFLRDRRGSSSRSRR
jgi:hypothetical protein